MEDFDGLQDFRYVQPKFNPDDFHEWYNEHGNINDYPLREELLNFLEDSFIGELLWQNKYIDGTTYCIQETPVEYE